MLRKIESLVATTIAPNFKRAHSKALESGCLSPFYLPPLDYDIVSRGEDRLTGYRDR